MINVNDIFDGVFCINLQTRTDRWVEVSAEFSKHNIFVERVDAVDGSKLDYNGPLLKGEVGALRSHKKVFELADSRGLEQILIFEDDVEFTENFNSQLLSKYTRVPVQWDMLYLGGNHVGGFTMVNESVARINHSYAIHAYAVKSNMFKSIIECLENEEKQVDVRLAELQSKCNAFVVRPHLAFQKQGFSDIQQGVVDYDFLRR